MSFRLRVALPLLFLAAAGAASAAPQPSTPKPGPVNTARPAIGCYTQDSKTAGGAPTTSFYLRNKGVTAVAKGTPVTVTFKTALPGGSIQIPQGTNSGPGSAPLTPQDTQFTYLLAAPLAPGATVMMKTYPGKFYGNCTVAYARP